MTSITPASSALSHAFARFDQASSDLARVASNGPGPDIATAIATQISAKEVVGASVALMKTQDEMTQALLDITV